MTDRYVPADAHAYVDNCLDRDSRAAFEASLRDDPQLRGRVELWQAQNEAIRAAFGGSGRLRGPLSIARPSNENLSPRVVAEAAWRKNGGAERAGLGGLPKGRARGSDAPASVDATPPARRRGRSGRRLALAALLALGLFCVSAARGPSDPREPLIGAGVAAYRAFATTNAAPLDIETHDPPTLLKSLGPKFAALDVAATLETPGWTLQGARIVPGTQSAAAFVVLENADRARVGILVEPLDAPMSTPPTSARRLGFFAASRTDHGFGVAVVGTEPSLVAGMIRRPDDLLGDH